MLMGFFKKGFCDLAWGGGVGKGGWKGGMGKGCGGIGLGEGRAWLLMLQKLCLK